MSITHRIEAGIERIPFGGCWIWIKSLGSHGYGQMMFADKKPRAVHRLSYETYKGPIPEGLHVLHRCDVRACCNPEHLFVGTPRDNMQDCKRKGRASKPPLGCNLKLTKQERDALRARRLNGESAKELAKEYGVHTSRVYQLVRGG